MRHSLHFSKTAAKGIEVMLKLKSMNILVVMLESKEIDVGMQMDNLS